MPCCRVVVAAVRHYGHVPEGDTVWLCARQLHETLAGHTLTETDFRVPSLATTTLAGWQVTEVASRGKHLLLRATSPTGEAASLHSHLRMDGAWRVYRPGERWRGGPTHLIRVVLRTDQAVAVGYHLHELAVVPTAQEGQLVGHLGPDLLGPDWNAEKAVRRLLTQPDQEISTALLDQRNLAGVGNLYKCEVLFLRGVSPWTRVRAVPDLPGLVDLAHRLLMANRHRWLQITTGSTRKGEQTWVFGRAGSPCRRCGETIRKVKGNGTAGSPTDRLTYWCPRCQPGERGTPPGTTRPLLARD